MTFRQDCEMFASFSMIFSPQNAQEEFYDKKKKNNAGYNGARITWIVG